ncbi:hypothetical protein BK139_13240 [Paenibacillus sp. FSL R5-0490]|uniref:hypothetical protein n=1 Tax=Paenibacillus sp. FSL R5-0490 TaxID=1920424 RepID=UPI00096E2E25|nr:hypothetical protein [Paenibacillus sp. FSL R5-0490]OMF59360.1 hypothetical protein BK139_13240 [Paenibacillus sp. FSL R5-0490]
MILLIRSNDLNPDPRAQKYIDFFEKENIEYNVLGWDRLGNALNKKEYTYYNRRAEFGKKLLNIKNKLLWFVFIFKYLFENKNEYKIVHACDFDTAFPAVLASIITRKKVVFDIFDWMSNDHEKNLIYKTIGFLERYTVRKADYVIICEEERKEQLKSKREDIMVMPNIPNIGMVEDKSLLNQIELQKSDYDIVVSYVGVFDSNRGLEDFLKKVSEKQNVLFNIAGFGYLQDLVIEYSKRYKNIVYWGKVDYNKGLNIMKNSDLILALYYNSNPLHKYAAPNKFYEGLMLGIPLITTKNTLVGAKTERYNTGFVIEEGYEGISDLLKLKDIKDLCTTKKDNCKYVWDNHYFNYINEFMNKDYISILNKESNI